jgi:beta-galactosidase
MIFYLRISRKKSYMRFTFISILLLLAVLPLFGGTPHHTFDIAGGNFLLDGKPFQIISGEMHFARIPREYWHQRLRMARAMGLNTIATYVFWNVHEPEEGKYNFSGNADVAAFVEAAREEGLWVLLRPSPYACAEWEFGGYPWWLLNHPDCTVRSRDPEFLEMSRKYFTELGNQLAPLQITRGGPIIMVQLENEYGSYGKDKEYLATNRRIIRDAGFDVNLYTCDGPSQMTDGYLPGILPAVNGLDDVPEVKKLINSHNDGKGPYFIAEWYPGWFDSWGLAHHTEKASEYAPVLDSVLANGCSINLYMAHGGTTRGFMNGANCDRRQPYLPQTCSYDYDAPIDEAGNATPKFYAFREVIKKHLRSGDVLPDVPVKAPVVTIPSITLAETASLFRNLKNPARSMRPLSFEDLGQGYGYVLYRTFLNGPRSGVLALTQLRDYACVFVNGKRAAVLDRRLGQDSAEISFPAGSDTLDLLLENGGRINYGPFLNDNRKGITGRVTLGGSELHDWEMYRLPFDNPGDNNFREGEKPSGPVLRRGTFNLGETGDVWLEMSSWGKGSVWLNGHHLGRYWDIGPTQTIYVPAPWLRKGKNEIFVFELLKPEQNMLRGLDAPILDRLTVPVVTVERSRDTIGNICRAAFSCSDSSAHVYYTMDGTLPDASSHGYTSALRLSSPVTVTARALLDGVWSEVPAVVTIDSSSSTGKKVGYATPNSPRYTAGGAGALTDGFRGSRNFRDGCWQGFEGTDMDCVIDLGFVHTVSSVEPAFYQDVDSWIFLPELVEISISENGKDFTGTVSLSNPVSVKQTGAIIQSFRGNLGGGRARYIRVHAKNIGVCPPWHLGAGGKAWLFIDEIRVDS